MANYHLFGLFWNLAFIIATVEFIIAGSVCNWYFQQGPGGQDTGNATIGSLKRYFRYHLGSVAVGSFLLAVINFIRFWLEYLYVNTPMINYSITLRNYGRRISSSSTSWTACVAACGTLRKWSNSSTRMLTSMYDTIETR